MREGSDAITVGMHQLLAIVAHLLAIVAHRLPSARI
jgi:hypothetical protein